MEAQPARLRVQGNREASAADRSVQTFSSYAAAAGEMVVMAEVRLLPGERHGPEARRVSKNVFYILYRVQKRFIHPIVSKSVFYTL